MKKCISITKRCAFLLFLLCGLSFQNSMAVDVTIGTGTSTTYNNPVYSGYSTSTAYSYTQQLYLASEITTGGGSSGQQISAISFYVSTGTTIAGNKTWVVYLGNTTKSSFSNTSDYVPVSSMTQVFSGTFNSGSASGWVSITLSTPFAWNGDNLVVAVFENSSGYGTTTYQYTSAYNRAMYKYSGSAITPSSPGAFNNLNSSRPNIKLTMGSMPSTPTTLWSQTFSSSSSHPSNIPSAQRSGWSPTGSSSYACEGSYAYYSTVGSGNYFATSNFHVPRGKGVKISFDTKRSSGSSTLTLYARVGGYASWSTLFNENSGWMRLHNNVSVSTTCTNYQVTVPGDICGGQDLSICFVANDNNVGVDNIQITDDGLASTVPNIASSPYTCNFNSSDYFYGPYTWSSYFSSSATGNIFSYRSYRYAGGDSYASISAGGGNDGKVNQLPVSGENHVFLYKNSEDPATPSPSGLPCFITKEFNTSTCTGSTATLRFAFFTTYAGYISNEDYRSYCPRIYYATTSDGTSGYSWTQATVNYYFPNGKWWYAATSLPKAQNLIVAFATKSLGDDYTNIDDIKIVNNDCSICTLTGGTISCTSNPGLSTYAPNTTYTFTIGATSGATYYKWIIRDLTTSGNPFYYGITAGATPAVISGQGAQTATINFGTSTSNTYRVMCIPYDEDPGTDNAPTDACYARLSYYSDITPLATCTDPTLTGASQAAPVCGSGSATINLTGMVANSTGNAIDYTINGVSQTQVTGINADGSGSASFTTASLTTGNNGQPLVITKITNGSCFTNFSQNLALSVKSLLNGNYTIGPAGDYPTFSAAVSDLMNCGVDPAASFVTFNVASGTYNEQVTIGSFSNPNNAPVTFQSATGNQADVTLSTPSSSSASNNYTLQINGADYLRFKNMTIARTGTNTYGTVVNISGNASYNQFYHIVFSGINGSDYKSSSVYSGDNNTGNTNNSFDGCYFFNGYTGVDWRGASGSLKPNISILNSTFENYAIGINMHYVQGAVITGNHLTNSSTFDPVSNYGLFGYYANNGLTISKNYFKYNTSSSNYGIALSNCSGSAGYVGDVSNNMIIVGSTYAYGIYVSGSSYKNFYFNSVYNNGAYAAGYASFYMASSSSVNVKNNNFYSTALYAMNIQSPTSGLSSCNYNNLYSTGSNLGNWGGTDCANLAAWQATSGKDANSVSGNPLFTSATDLHCTSGSAASNAGLVIAGITTDFDGETRQTGTSPVDGPDIGADEFTGCVDFAWTGAVNTDWNTPGNWSCNTLPTSTTDVIIPNVTNQPVVNSTGYAVCRNISIEASSSVTVNSSKDLSVYGNWTNSGQSFTGDGTVIFTGTSAQTISGINTFGNLTINNSSGATLTNTTNLKGILTPTLGTLTTNDHLTLLSTASQTALIAGTGSGSVTGNVTMQRYMANRMGYHYYASPFAAAPVNEFTNEIGTIISGDPYGGGTDTTQTVTPFPNFFAYDETMGPTMSIGWTDAGSTLQPLRGYCINFGASSGALTTDITGEVSDGPQNYGVTKTTTTKPGADGWNLVGNPYPSPVDWQSTGWNKAYINDAIYYFTPNSQYYGNYSSFVNGFGTGGATGIVAAMQGFFVRATGSGNLSVNNTARVNNLNPAFYKTLSNTPLLRLQGYPSQNSSYSDETVIYFDPQATGDFDGSYDAYKLMNNSPNLPNIYTSYNASPALSINGMPPLSNTDVVIPLGFLTQTNGNFTINASEILNFDPSLHIYLEDNQMSAIQDLTTNPAYTFSMNANAPQYRFFIRFSPSILTGIEENGSSFVDAWASGKDIYVNYSNSSLQPAEISVYNMLGQTVISGTQEGRGTMRYTVDKPGCYIINVISTNGSYQKKVVIL